MIYVDELCSAAQSGLWRHGVFCHMTADTTVELDVMAAKLKLPPRVRCRISGSGDYCYNLTANKRDKAVKLGARVLAPIQLVAECAMVEGNAHFCESIDLTLFYFSFSRHTGDLMCNCCRVIVPVQYTDEERSWFGSGPVIGSGLVKCRLRIIKDRIITAMREHYRVCAMLRNDIAQNREERDA